MHDLGFLHRNPANCLIKERNMQEEPTLSLTGDSSRSSTRAERVLMGFVRLSWAE